MNEWLKKIENLIKGHIRDASDYKNYEGGLEWKN